MLKGRYGPYVTDRKKNAKVPKDREPASLTLEECQALLAAAPERKGRFGRRAKKAASPRPALPATQAGAEARATEEGRARDLRRRRRGRARNRRKRRKPKAAKKKTRAQEREARQSRRRSS